MTHDRRIVPPSLKVWFVIHFAADIGFALPLFLAPRAFLGMLGWTEVDPVASRLVAAALFGIGVQSLLGRNESIDAFRGMLNLKIIWSSTAIIGLVWSALDGGPTLAWGFTGVFMGFSAVWWYYRVRLGKNTS